MKHPIFYTMLIYTIVVLSALSYGGITGLITYHPHDTQQPLKVKQLARSVFDPIDRE